MDQELVRAVQRHIDVDSAGSVDQMLRQLVRPEAEADLERLAGALAEDSSDLEALHLLGRALLLRWYARGADGTGDLERAVEVLADCFVAGVEPTAAMDDVLAAVVGAAAERAEVLLESRRDPEGTAWLWCRIVIHTPVDDPRFGRRLGNAAAACLVGHEALTRPDLLRLALMLGGRAVEAAHDDAEALPALLVNRASALRASLDAEAYAEVAADHLDELIDVDRRAVDATAQDPALRLWALEGHSTDLWRRYTRGGNRADLAAATESARRCAEETPGDAPPWTVRRKRLAQYLRTGFDLTGARADLDDAIGYLHDILRAARYEPEDHTAILADLCGTLVQRHEHFGRPEDLDEAIGAARQAVAAATDALDRALALSNLGSALRVKFRAGGDLRLLDEAAVHGNEAVALTPPGHENHPVRMSLLALSLEERFEFTGNLDDLDHAIRLKRQASLLNPEFSAFNNLGLALLNRYLSSYALAFVEEAADVLEQAVRLCPPGHAVRPVVLSNLGKVLHFRWLRTHRPEDLARAVESCTRAVELTPPDHPEAATHWNNLGAVLFTRYSQSHRPADLDQALDAGGMSVRHTPGGHPYRAGRLANLACSYFAGYERTGEAPFLDTAIATARQAVEAGPGAGRAEATCLNNLAVFLAARTERPETPTEQRDADRAEIESLGTAVARMPGVPAVMRIDAARSAAEQALAAAPGRAAALFEEAVHLLPRAASRAIGRDDRQALLRDLRGLASAGAAACLRAAEEEGDTGRRAPERALLMLETGRAVILGQTLETRGDFSALRERHPEAAARLDGVLQQLDAPGTHTEAQEAPTTRRGDDRYAFGRELDDLLEEIRRLPGFSGFLRPPTIRELTDVARHGAGPVVVLTAHPTRSDALLVTADGVVHLPLPRLDFDDTVRRAIRFHRARSASRDPRLGAAERKRAQAELRHTLEWLWDAVAEPVLDRLGHRTTPADGEPWPRLWWAPGGVLSLLPLHAAGHHLRTGGSPGADTVMDRVISSYTPTLRALRHTRRAAAPCTSPPSSLIVAVPEAAGTSPLPGARAEAEHLRAVLPAPHLLGGADPRPQPPEAEDGAAAAGPDSGTVLRHINGSTIVHFACHAVSDAADPSRSGLLVDGAERPPLTVARLAALRLDRAELAYLSACSTALNPSLTVLDESIHLTGALQMAGFRHVVGTLWDIEDSVAPRVASAFYDALLTASGEVDTSRAATALHRAVRSLRDQAPQLPARWAAYLHAGA